MTQGLRGSRGVAAPPFTAGPYFWDQHVTFTGGLSGANTKGSVAYVDGTSGSDGNRGKGWSDAYKTIQAAVTAVGAYGVVFVAPKEMTAGVTDPGDYAETIIIPATHECLSIIGVGNRTQGGLPQIKKGAGTTAQITIRAAGCRIIGLGINGGSATGGGILLDDDGSTKSAFGTEIAYCHFKNCVGTTATNAATGGAIQWSSAGGAWQVWIHDNNFYKNVGDIVLLGTSASVPQDVVIERNVFSGPAANVDCNLYLMGGSGMNGVYIIGNVFPAKPTIGSGTNARFIMATGCVGILASNYFGTSTVNAFAAAGSQAYIPTTMFLAGNWGESANLVTRS